MTPDTVKLALGALEDAIAGLAEKKNVPLTGDDPAVLARVVMDRLPVADVLGISLMHRETIVRVSQTIMRTLDVLLIARATMQRAQHLGMKNVSTQAAIAAAARALDDYIANDGAEPVCFCWPDSPKPPAPEPLPIVRPNTGSMRARAMLGCAMNVLARIPANAAVVAEGGPP